MAGVIGSEGRGVIAAAIIFEVLTFFAIILRFWALRLVRRKWACHDTLIIFAFICVTGLAICLILSVTIAGLGTHATELAITPWKVVNFRKLLFAVQVCWAVGMTATRLSILSLYLYLFDSASLCWGFLKTVRLMMLSSLLWLVGELLLVFLICRPLSSNWEPSIEATCGNQLGGYISVHCFNVAIDLCIALLPAPVLWRLQMPKARKVGVILMFAVGAIVCVISILRLALYQGVLDYTDPDFTYKSTTLYLFTAIDSSFSVILACLPLLRPVGDRLKMFSALNKMWASIATPKDQPSNVSSIRLGHIGIGSSDALNTRATASAEGQHMHSPPAGSGIAVNCQFEQRFEHKLNHKYEMNRP